MDEVWASESFELSHQQGLITPIFSFFKVFAVKNIRKSINVTNLLISRYDDSFQKVVTKSLAFELGLTRSNFNDRNDCIFLLDSVLHYNLIHKNFLQGDVDLKNCTKIYQAPAVKLNCLLYFTENLWGPRVNMILDLRADRMLIIDPFL